MFHIIVTAYYNCLLCMKTASRSHFLCFTTHTQYKFYLNMIKIVIIILRSGNKSLANSSPIILYVYEFSELGVYKSEVH